MSKIQPGDRSVEIQLEALGHSREKSAYYGSRAGQIVQSRGCSLSEALRLAEQEDGLAGGRRATDGSFVK